MADFLYELAGYWPFIACVFGLGILVGWWAEGAPDPRDVEAWLDRGHDPP